jgi:uncharacterized protein (DUF1015 family)
MTISMAKVFPFSAVLYNKKVVSKLDKVMAPPYDVISPELQNNLYERHPYNVIRLILGKEFPGDSDSNNKYLRAETFFTSWLKHGLLKEDEEPGLYVYEQKYSVLGKKLVRRGFFCLLRLEDFDRGKVMPHEETFLKPKADRLEMLRTCSANFESVFSIFSDEKDYVDKVLKKYSRRKPAVSVRDDDGVIHSVWMLDGKPDIRKVMKAMADKTVFIADGHHRYEASLKYRDEMREKFQKFTGDEKYNHILMYLTPIEGKGLSILPIHRLIRTMQDFDVPSFESALQEYFVLETLPFGKRNEEQVRKKVIRLMEKAGEGEHFFGMLMAGVSKYYILKLKDEKMVDKFVKDGKPKEWKRLDVTILHSMIIGHILGLTSERIDTEEHVTYVKDAGEAAKKVFAGGYQMAFLLNPTKVGQIIKIAGEKEKMPQKSTYFYPKLLSGLLMNRIHMDEKVAMA